MTNKIDEIYIKAQQSVSDTPEQFKEAFARLLLKEFYSLIGDQKLSYHFLERYDIVDVFYEFEDIVEEHFSAEKNPNG
jgi:hypothetical protein